MSDAIKDAGVWIFRGVIGLIMILGGITGYLAKNTLDGLTSEISLNRSTTWAAIGQLNKATTDLTTSMTGLTTTVQDHIHDDSGHEASIDRLVQDHEARIRQLERDDSAQHPGSHGGGGPAR